MVTLGTLVAAGRTSDVYEFGADAVVKVPRADVPDHWVALEAEFTAAVRTLDVPAPSVVDVIEVEGRTAIVLQRIEGRSLWEHILDEPHRVAEFATVLADTQRAIFAAGPPEGLDGLVDRMCRKIDGVDHLSLAERLEATTLATAQPKGAALLHGDLHPGNVLMTGGGPMVIDWFDASIGHPVADVVRSSILMRPHHDAASPAHLPGAEPALLEALHDAYLDAMSDLLAIDPDVLHDWETLAAVSRLAEGDQHDAAALSERWRRRDDPGSSALLDRVNLDRGERSSGMHR